MSRSFFIGWDVGGWNCDNNPRSRDAIVILDEDLRIVGAPWRGNLRTVINEAATTQQWTACLFGLCGREPAEYAALTLAIDAPLGFPAALLALTTHLEPAGPIGDSPTNPYLYRHTERALFTVSAIGILEPIGDRHIGTRA